jgi:hypothetical protein
MGAFVLSSLLVGTGTRIGVAKLLRALRGSSVTEVLHKWLSSERGID